MNVLYAFFKFDKFSILGQLSLKNFRGSHHSGTFETPHRDWWNNSLL